MFHAHPLWTNPTLDCRHAYGLVLVLALWSAVAGAAERGLVTIATLVSGGIMQRARLSSAHSLRLFLWIVTAFVLLVPGARPAWAVSTDLLLAPVGEAAADLFGISVGTAGDVNGDGFDDLIVGASQNDGGGQNAGRAYVYYSGPGADATPDLTFTGEAAGDRFGLSAETAGDVNGDGFDDLIVGARQNDGGGQDAGRAYVFYGGPGADAASDLTFTGEMEDDWFGFSVGTAGDVNGDGFDDLIAGAPFNEAGGTLVGRAYVYYGGPGADATPDLTFTGEATFDQFGISAATAGDVNGDGFDDLIVGARGTTQGIPGKAYVYYGGPGADATPDLFFTGAMADDEFGFSVGTAGDVDGDGFDDLIVGAHWDDAGGNHAGRAYLYYGGPGADATPDLTFTGEAADDQLGASVGTAGDVNGDGFDDLIVGAFFNDAGGPDAGRALVYYGGPWADAIADITFNGEAADDLFGLSVGTAGDVDGDGFDDLIVGANRNNGGGPDAGRAYVYSVFPYRLESPNGGEQWVAGQPVVVRWQGHDVADLYVSFDGGASWSLLASGIGGDDENEYVAVAPGITTEFAMVRLTYAPFFAPTVSNSVTSADVFRIVSPHHAPSATLTRSGFAGEASGDQFGRAVSGAGDVNADGFDDLLVGAWRNDAAGTEAGRAYVYYRGPDADDVADLVLTGEAAGDWFGVAVSDAGDVNGDGFADFIVGAERNDAVGANAGRAYVYYGGPGADEIADWVFSGGDRLGHSVSDAGDVNGDGYDDVIVGAILNDDGGTDAGRASVFFGGPAADTVADLLLTGEAAGDQLGTSLSAAGDVNGDGYGDVVVGAANSAATATDAGRAYIYLGGPSADGTPDLIVSGQVAGAFLGTSVADAGDVNGDGFGDVLIGAPGDLGSGRAYLFLGGPALDESADLVLVGDADGDFFGMSVSGAGDVNDDGFDDFIVGAINAGGGGRASIYFGGPGADAVAEVVLESEADGDLFGVSVSGTGDTNGDGFADVLIGSQSSGPPSRAYLFDFNRYVVVSPAADDLWNVGATQTISWLGAERADVWLSVDGGSRYTTLAADVGGNTSNAIVLTVPHQPTRYAQIKVTPHAGGTTGGATSDSLFTIEATITLMRFAADPVEDGIRLSWETDPGPENLAGYTIKRLPSGDVDWQVLASGIRETSYLDRDGVSGRYRLTATNGLGIELELGEITLAPRVALAAWPLPYREGDLSIRFATFGGLGGGVGHAEVSVFDVTGRLVRTIATGEFPAGQQSISWDGRDAVGRPVSAGVYFLQAHSAGESTNLKLVVMR